MCSSSAIRTVFLSHSGLDAARATALATRLERELASRRFHVEVFNTSESEHRCKDLRYLLESGEDWRTRAGRYEEELRAYLAKNMSDAAAFVSLVTPTSLIAASKVIEFELDTAHEIARMRQTPFFFPCVADGATLRELPRRAIEFQGVELDGESGMARLVEAIARALKTR
jgi:hypothetical protein